MKIHFCDLCNESVPQADLDGGRAFLRKGRVVCAACDRAMSHHVASGIGAETAGEPGRVGFDTATHDLRDLHAIPPGAPTGFPGSVSPSEPPPVFASTPVVPLAHVPHVVHTRSTSSGGLWVGLLGLAFTAGVIFVLDERLQIVEQQSRGSVAALEERKLEVNSLQRRDVIAEDRARDVERRFAERLDAEKARREEMAVLLSRMQQENSELKARLGTLVSAMATLEHEAGAGDFEMEKRIADLSARLAHSEDEARALAVKLGEIEAAPPVVSVPDLAPEGATPEVAWHQQLGGLKSDSASTRWEAVTNLGATKDLETVPYIAPMLKDPDIFVRMAAARVLGDMQAKGGVPALIDALEDVETAVREAANIALRTITGKDFKFDPLAIEAERTRRVKAWRDWWKKEAETPSGM